MTTLEQAGRRLALAFINLDDIVFAKGASGMGLGQLAQAGKSAVGGAMVGGGMAARAAVFGAQVATRSARVATGVVKDIIPGGDMAEEILGEMQKRIAAGGEDASLLATRGVELGRPDGAPTTDPLLDQVWLDKRMEPGSTWNSALADTLFDLARLAALPLTIGSDAIGTAMGTGLGTQMKRASWRAVSSIVDGAADESDTSEPADRTEQRALLLGLALAPFWQATSDLMSVGEGLSRASLGDNRKLREAVAQVVERLEMSGDDEEEQPDDPWIVKAMRARARAAAAHTPAHVLDALGETGGDLATDYVTQLTATLEDGNNLGALAGIYGQLMAMISLNSFNSMVNGSLDVAEIEGWVAADEASRGSSSGSEGTRQRCPTSLEQIESIVAATSSQDPDAPARGFLTGAMIELARDTVFAYSARALGRERGLDRVERIFGKELRDRLDHDCSLRREILEAGSVGDRDHRIHEQVEILLLHGVDRVRAAREGAASRLDAMADASCDSMLTLMLPHRVEKRAAILQRFLGMADQAVALHAVPTEEPARARVFATFDEWLGPDTPVTPVHRAAQ